MPPKCSPCLMLTLPQQSNATSYFLAGTSLLPKLNADSQCLPWGSSLSLCPSTCSNPLSPLICKVQLSTSTLQPSSCCISSTAHSHLAGSLKAWSWTFVTLQFGVSFHCWNLWAVSHVSAELNACLSQEDVGHMSCPRFSSQGRMAAWEGADRLTATDLVSS